MAVGSEPACVSRSRGISLRCNNSSHPLTAATTGNTRVRTLQAASLQHPFVPFAARTRVGVQHPQRRCRLRNIDVGVKPPDRLVCQIPL